MINYIFRHQFVNIIHFPRLIDLSNENNPDDLNRSIQFLFSPQTCSWSMFRDNQRQWTFSPTWRGCYRSCSILIWVTCVRWLLGFLLGLLLGGCLCGWSRQSEKFGDWYSLNWGDWLDIKVNFGWLVRFGVRSFVIRLLMEFVRRQTTSKSVTRNMNRVFMLSIISDSEGISYHVIDLYKLIMGHPW